MEVAVLRPLPLLIGHGRHCVCSFNEQMIIRDAMMMREDNVIIIIEEKGVETKNVNNK